MGEKMALTFYLVVNGHVFVIFFLKISSVFLVIHTETWSFIHVNEFSGIKTLLLDLDPFIYMQNFNQSNRTTQIYTCRFIIKSDYKENKH